MKPQRSVGKFTLTNSLCFIIRCYQYIVSPLMPPCCRFYPSCSHYALQAIRIHGVFKGLWLTCRRLLRCHPWSDGGYDPVLLDIGQTEMNNESCQLVKEKGATST